MLLRTFAAAALIMGMGCSSSGGDPDPVPNPDPGTPGATTGVWIGDTAFGSSVFVIDNDQRLVGFSSNGSGLYESIFGDASRSGPMEVYAHRDSDDTSIGTGITVVGDTQDSRIYSFSVTSDGQSLTNSGEAGAFSLTLADANDLPDLTLAGVAGTWEARTGIGDPAASLIVSMTIASNGTLTGFTQFAEFDQLPFSGTATSAGQFLAIDFTWNGNPRVGAAYIEPATGRLILNTVGFESAEEGNLSFTATMIKQ